MRKLDMNGFISVPVSGIKFEVEDFIVGDPDDEGLSPVIATARLRLTTGEIREQTVFICDIPPGISDGFAKVKIGEGILKHLPTVERRVAQDLIKNKLNRTTPQLVFSPASIIATKMKEAT